MQTNRFGVRPFYGAGEPGWFEVFEASWERGHAR
jgi:hypothetical protein